MERAPAKVRPSRLQVEDVNVYWASCEQIRTILLENEKCVKAVHRRAAADVQQMEGTLSADAE